MQYCGLLGIKPTAVIGHSLGEYAALVAAGVLSVADALFLVGKRAELMLALCQRDTHAMWSIRGASVERIQEMCRKAEEQCSLEFFMPERLERRRCHRRTRRYRLPP